jgi:hypothetical protein
VGGSLTFTATVTGAADQTVTWTADRGTIVGGVYTAPATAGADVVRVTTAAQPAATATAAITVTAVVVTPPAVALSPTSASVQVGGSLTFTATVTGAADHTVVWTADRGTIANGVYTAPAVAGADAVHATTAAQPAATATASITVTASGGVTKLVEGRAYVAMPAWSKPAKGVALSEPTYHTAFVRATDHVADGLTGFARNDYSRRQAWNADNSRYLLYALDGSWWLYDAHTYALIKKLSGLAGDAEPQWHPTDPNTLYYVPINGGTQLLAKNIVDDTSRVVADFAGKLPWPNVAHVWTRSEGSPSRDARFWGFQAEDASFGILGFIVWDLVNNRLVGSVSATVRPDHVSMTPSGRWIVVSGDGGTWAWTPDFTSKKQLHTSTEHSDLAALPNGDDAYVSIDYGSNDGTIFMVDIDTGVRTNLIPTYPGGSASAFHFSGKAFAKPGWVLIGGYSGSGPAQWFMDKLFIMELAANPRVYQLAFHRSVPAGQYWAEPHGSVNRDFTKVVVNSNWLASGSQDVDAYQISIPAGSFP